jgi:hypothetical protein
VPGSRQNRRRHGVGSCELRFLWPGLAQSALYSVWHPSKRKPLLQNLSDFHRVVPKAGVYGGTKKATRHTPGRGNERSILIRRNKCRLVAGEERLVPFRTQRKECDFWFSARRPHGGLLWPRALKDAADVELLSARDERHSLPIAAFWSKHENDIDETMKRCMRRDLQNCPSPCTS